MNAPTMTIRPARDDDGTGLAELLQAVFAEYAGCLYADEEFPELAAPARHYHARGGGLWVMERHGAIAGCTAIVPKVFPGVWELSKVYLHANLRGSGAAQQLLQTAQHFAEARGATRIILYSDTRFTRGHGFYAKHGFIQMPGTRVLHDVSHSLEFGFARGLTETAA